MLEAFLKITERQGRLQGDLNSLQRNGLAWLMNQEIKEDVAIERIRLENQALASNPQTSGPYLKQMLERQAADEGEDEMEEGMEVDWHTPTDAAEVEDVLRNLGLQVPS